MEVKIPEFFFDCTSAEKNTENMFVFENTEGLVRSNGYWEYPDVGSMGIYHGMNRDW